MLIVAISVKEVLAADLAALCWMDTIPASGARLVRQGRNDEFSLAE
jgi:hypothetical protein